MSTKSTLFLIFLASILLGFLFELAPRQRPGVAANDHPIVPISCGLGLLLAALSKHPSVAPVKPTLLMLAVSSLVYGALVIILDDERFRTSAGHQISTFLYRFKFTVGGIAIGGVLSSIFYGHWNSALEIAVQSRKARTEKKTAA